MRPKRISESLPLGTDDLWESGLWEMRCAPVVGNAENNPVSGGFRVADNGGKYLTRLAIASDRRLQLTKATVCGV
jgi:hypothetical protein